MITPRRTRLVRVADLHAFQRAIAHHGCPRDLADVRSTAVLVSSHAAVAELRHTLENRLLEARGDDRPVAAWPDILTRDEWYERLHHAARLAPRLLGAIEREVLMAAAARCAIAAGHAPPFRLRPALVGEMVSMLDTMLRLGRTIDSFERLTVEELEPRVSIDRGAERLLQQTFFLVAAFREYRRLVSASEALDEHLLREHLLQHEDAPPFTRVVLAVGDRSCGSDGLWPVDFDLLTRLPHVEHIDVIATENVLAAGFHERLADLLPGFEEVEFGHPAALSGRVPRLVTPSGQDVAWWVSRDREEELASIARRIKSTVSSCAAGPDLDRVSIVCKRPLPYVYLAHAHLERAGIPFQAFDDLPLAAEPYAAAVDLVLRLVESRFARRQAIAVLRSPHFAFCDGDVPIRPDAVTALERVLRAAGISTGLVALESIAERWSRPEAGGAERAAVPAARALSCAIGSLEPLARKQSASVQFDILLAFLQSHATRQPEAGDTAARTARARAAIVNALRELRDAHRAHDDPASEFEEFALRIRRWMEAQTFSPRKGTGGVHLVDATTAKYGDFDEVHLVGLIEREWPDQVGRTIFYPLALLNQLGWPPERLRLAAARAAFRDLVRLAGTRVSVSSFLLEDDALVEPSPFLDELDRSGLAVRTEEAPGNLRVLPEEALSLEPVRVDVLDVDARPWAEMRLQRSTFDDCRYRGTVGPLNVRTHAVRRIETYLDCPFKYLAESVLRLEDPTDEDPAEGPRAQGQFLHELLRDFFEAWQSSGRGSISHETIDHARALFVEVAETRLAALGRADAALWKARLFGTPARTGIGEIVFRAEAATRDEVRERLLEYRLDGACRLQTADASREVNLRGVADRIDVLDGNRLRLVDYKLGRAPDVRRAVQLPVYAVQAVQQFASDGGGTFVPADAGYLAFGERVPHVRLTARALTLEQAIAAGEERALAAIAGIERGEFPPRPADNFMCGYCPYANVCRKDYGDGQ